MDNQAVQVSSQRHHRDRVLQVPIYLGKLMRSFIYQNDWKVLPMSVLIAALLSMVIRNSFFITREGTLKGAFGLTCVALWNGCFNAILSVCRERRIVKREHRSGMHISSYMFAHMIYQAMLCLAQTVLTLYVCQLLAVQFPTQGFITPWFLLDLGITVFLITYSAAMTSLFFSSLAHTTTTALTIMPFLLIFQLVFSGGIFSLPAWTNALSNFTLSNYGLKCVAAQSGYNQLPMTLGWDTLAKCENETIHIEVTGNQIIQISTKPESPIAKTLHGLTLDESDGETVGDLIDKVVASGVLDEFAGETYVANFTLKDVFDTVGKDTVRQIVIDKTSAASSNPAYELSKLNVFSCWGFLFMIGAAFAFMSVVVMEFIDNDKR